MQVSAETAPRTGDGAGADLSGTTALVTGASRGFGRGIASTLVRQGAQVIGVARTPGPLHELQDRLGDRFTAVVGDATEAELARDLLAQHRPRLLILVAGAIPVMRPLQEHTWETLSTNWDADVQHAFHWTAEALRQPLAPGSHVISFSSGSALKGSPLSAGYAGANATIRFVSAYAQQESDRADLGLRFTALLPQLSPATDLGATGVAAYAERAGIEVDDFVAAMPHILTPELMGTAVLGIATAVGADRPAAYRILETGHAEPLG